MHIVKIYEKLSSEGRRYAQIEYDDGTRKTKTYAKCLMEMEYGRELDPEKETVDHIDRNKTNDVIENLRVIPRSQHSSEDAKRLKKIQITCIFCGNTSFKSFNNLKHSSQMGKAGPFCSRQCSGLYGALVQNGIMEQLPSQPIPDKIEYYTSKDNLSDDNLFTVFDYHLPDEIRNKLPNEIKNHIHHNKPITVVNCSFCDKEFIIKTAQYKFKIKNGQKYFCCSHSHQVSLKHKLNRKSD
jgi:hypothetical protein